MIAAGFPEASLKVKELSATSNIVFFSLALSVHYFSGAQWFSYIESFIKGWGKRTVGPASSCCPTLTPILLGLSRKP